MAFPFRISTRSAGLVHLWQYESLANREQRRDAMEADPDSQAYRRVALEEDTIIDMEKPDPETCVVLLAQVKG